MCHYLTDTVIKKSKTEQKAAANDVSTGDLTTPTNTGSLLSTSLADMDDKRGKLRAKIEELQGIPHAL